MFTSLLWGFLLKEKDMQQETLILSAVVKLAKQYDNQPEHIPSLAYTVGCNIKASLTK